MEMLPVTTCARLLGIHPKTFTHWLTQANFPFAPHPTDARIKCVAQEHFREVARRHDRPHQLSTPPVLLDGASLPNSSQNHVLFAPEHDATSFQTDLLQKRSCLETKVATLQEHLAHLALALLQEREHSVERRLSTLETTTSELVGTVGFSPSLPERQSSGTEGERVCAVPVPRLLNPAEQRARSRLPALIEYAADGSYVTVSSLEGDLSLIPESPEWFDWLATISSFRFLGHSGRFTAYRESKRGEPTRSWSAHRTIHQRRYKHTLGVTDRLTIAWLEQTAATLRADADMF